MIILFISHLSTNIAAGPNWSVPACVDAQSKIDDVLWINMTNVVMPHWQNVLAFRNLSDFGAKLSSLDILPAPFNHPNVVVFEGLYYLDDVEIAKHLNRNHIPYIIVPRGSLTKQALHNHAWFKKRVAHLLYFNRFINKAAAIQYLTKQEASDSLGHFCSSFFIIPNGINSPNIENKKFSTGRINACFIGRLDIYHKGLDLLLDAITLIHGDLFNAHFFLNIYGPRRYDYNIIASIIVERKLTDIVAIHDEVGGREKEEVLLNSDLFIMTSRFEGHPMGLIEALAYGIPCIVTPGTNMAEEIKINNAGWVCEGTPSAISLVLKEIVSEEDKFIIKSNNAQSLSKEYSWDRIAKDFHNNLERLLNDRI